MAGCPMPFSPSWLVILQIWDFQELVKLYEQGLFARYEKIGPEKVMGTIVVDRILDLLSLLFAIVLAIILQGQVLLLTFFQEELGDSVLGQSLVVCFDSVRNFILDGPLSIS